MRSGSQPSIGVGAVELEVERVEVGAEQLGQHLGRGAELGVAVLVGLHDRGVHAERHVVHEDAAVDPGQIDPPLVAVGERVERADDVVAVDAEIEGEVIPGAGGDAHERHVVLRRHPGDQCLRPVAAGHADDVGAPRDRVSAASVSRSSPASSMTVSMPLACAAAANSGLAFPPPDRGFMISTGCRAAPTGTPGGRASTSAARLARMATRAKPRAGQCEHDRPPRCRAGRGCRRRVTKADHDGRHRDERGEESYDTAPGDDVPRRRRRHHDRDQRAEQRQPVVPEHDHRDDDRHELRTAMRRSHRAGARLLHRGDQLASAAGWSTCVWYRSV